MEGVSRKFQMGIWKIFSLLLCLFVGRIAGRFGLVLVFCGHSIGCGLLMVGWC
jgi:hypothetical protein